MFIVSVEANGLDPYQTPPKTLLSLNMSFLLYVASVATDNQFNNRMNRAHKLQVCDLQFIYNL